MALNATFWRRYFQKEFFPQIDAIVDTLERRLLPAFANIEREAQKASEDAWNAFMEMPGTGDEDPSAFVEEAEQAGVSYYILFDGIRQGMLNLFAAALHHAFEQQVMLFHRRELLRQTEENDVRLMSFQEFSSRLSRYGIDVSLFQSWEKLKELRLLANVVKHAQGKAAEALSNVRPDLYENPGLKEFGLARNPRLRVLQPLIGEDLYVALQDVKEYRDAVRTFWQDLGAAMESV